ncbi:hypothetical protein BC941DRAFT_408743 [Chlamydoabsidia padenii]|nr:hypothetical protein BC941DRAFT_408743 [Chlamydoabsidia padenii]
MMMISPLWAIWMTSIKLFLYGLIISLVCICVYVLLYSSHLPILSLVAVRIPSTPFYLPTSLSYSHSLSLSLFYIIIIII